MRRGLPSLRGASLNSPVSALACSRQRSSFWTTSSLTSLLPASSASGPSSSEKPLRPSPTSRLACKPHNLLSHALFDIRRAEMRTLWKEKILEAVTPHLVLAPDAAIDLQMHTTSSDGTWTPEQLIEYLVSERFGLIVSTPQDSWRYLKLALECPAESSFRAVPESISCLTRAHALLTNPAPGEGHPPPCHVLHGSHPHQSGESLSKDRSRQVDFPREGGHGPGFLSAMMDQREHMPNVRITQRSQPAESPVLVSLQPCSDGLEHEDVRQAH